jgi:hypothetical protein
MTENDMTSRTSWFAPLINELSEVVDLPFVEWIPDKLPNLVSEAFGFNRKPADWR